jgi:GntR family transcriptional regulator, rspAB operon transcriptional repressor
VRQAHFLRSNLELPLVRQLCAADHLDLSRPRAVLLEQELQLTGIDFAAFMPLDDAFHRALFELGGMAEIWSVIHARKAQLDRIRFLQAPQDGKVPTLVAEHRAILDAIARHDAPLAEMVLRKHIAGAMLYMEELLLLQPELFETVLSSRPRSAVLQP